jgi:hypothetical protein
MKHDEFISALKSSLILTKSKQKIYLSVLVPHALQISSQVSNPLYLIM